MTNLDSVLSQFEVGTFAGLPRQGLDRSVRAAILGLPFDTGTNSFRIGCRQGPNHIRHAWLPDRRFLFHSDQDFLGALGAVDLGNVAVTPSQLAEAFERIDQATAAVLDAGAVPITLGGDGSVTLPQLRAAYRRYGPLAVVHCDAHTDTSDVAGAGRYTTTTTFLRAAEEGLVLPELTFHIGARGTLSALTGTKSNVSGVGHRIISMDDLLNAGTAAVAEQVVTTIDGKPTYLCWDMDFFDPSAAPGVAMPEWGGASPREGLALLNALAPLRTVLLDVNTVSPPHDVQGMTGNLAGRVILEFLALLASSDPSRSTESG